MDRRNNGDSAGQSLDEMLELLSSQRRRQTLSILVDRSQEVAVAELAEEIAAREHEVSIEENENGDTQRVHSMLYHKHLPKLADAGAISYDKDRGVVQALETDSRAQRVLAFATNDGEVR